MIKNETIFNNTSIDINLKQFFEILETVHVFIEFVDAFTRWVLVVLHCKHDEIFIGQGFKFHHISCSKISGILWQYFALNFLVGKDLIVADKC